MSTASLETSPNSGGGDDARSRRREAARRRSSSSSVAHYLIIASMTTRVGRARPRRFWITDMPVATAAQGMAETRGSATLTGAKRLGHFHVDRIFHVSLRIIFIKIYNPLLLSPSKRRISFAANQPCSAAISLRSSLRGRRRSAKRIAGGGEARFSIRASRVPPSLTSPSRGEGLSIFLQSRARCVRENCPSPLEGEGRVGGQAGE
jgi:hypothetical protein